MLTLIVHFQISINDFSASSPTTAMSRCSCPHWPTSVGFTRFMMFYKVSVSLVVVVCTAVQWCHQLRVGHETPVLWATPASLTLTLNPPLVRLAMPVWLSELLTPADCWHWVEEDGVGVPQVPDWGVAPVDCLTLTTAWLASTHHPAVCLPPPTACPPTVPQSHRAHLNTANLHSISPNSSSVSHQTVLISI